MEEEGVPQKKKKRIKIDLKGIRRGDLQSW